MSHAYATTPLIEQTRRDEQERLAQRHNATPTRLYRSAWVIETLRDRLSPEHVSLAQRLLTRQAEAEGVRAINRERIDGVGNSAESALIGRLDAQRELTGYEAAIRSKLARSGFLCFRGIVEGDGFAQLMRRCGYGVMLGSAKRSAVELVQLTMHVAGDYRDQCDADRTAWNASP